MVGAGLVGGVGVGLVVDVATATAVSAAMAGRVLAVTQDLKTVVNNITTWVVGISASIATLFLTIGGLRLLLAGSDPGEVAKGKEALKSAALGYGVVLLAPVLAQLIKSFVGG